MTRMTAETGHETYQFAGGRLTILVDGAATGGRFALLRAVQPPGNGTPPHLHHGDWETICVERGTIRVETRGASFDLPAGSVRPLPAGEVHRLVNVGDEAAVSLILCVPAGFEGFVRAVGERIGDPDAAPRPMSEAEVARLIETAPRFGIELAPGAPPASEQKVSSAGTLPSRDP